MKKLTKKQLKIYRWIKKYIRYNHGISPTYRDIAKDFDITVKGAYDHLQALHKKGYIGIMPGIARGVYLR